MLDFAQRDITYKSTTLHYIPDKAVPEELQSTLLRKIADSKPPERKIDFLDTVGLPENDWWKQSAKEFIETNIGRSGGSDPLNVWFGAKAHEGGKNCSHGMLAAMTGAGKSNLYHVLIMGLSLRYAPDELSLYLIDGKDGVEFQAYTQLPHAEFVSLKSQPQLSRAILAELLDEKERRNEYFRSLGVKDYTSFRALKSETKSLPRILLLVDEYQELFVGDREGTASMHLLSLAQQGRSVGIHMLLGSQRFGSVGMLHQAAIFGNVHLRVAMKMALADRNALGEFGKEGKELIATCNLPGKLVLNDQSGDDGANKLGKVAMLEPQIRDELIQKLIDRTNEDERLKRYRTTNIFNGNEQPDLVDNPQLDMLRQSTSWLSDQDVEKWARQPVFQGGLGEQDWFHGEKPVVGWLGQEYNVHGYAKVILKRRKRENVLVIGDRNDARYGMVKAMLAGMALNASPRDLIFKIIDKSVPGTPWNQELKQLVETFLTPLGYNTQVGHSDKDVFPILNELILLIQERKQLDEIDRLNIPSVILVISEADRIDDLVQTTGKYGLPEQTDLGEQLQTVIENGPSLGIHLVLLFESVLPMMNVVDKKSLDLFRHRIALQMSEEDSFTFVKNRQASRLQGKRP